MIRSRRSWCGIKSDKPYIGRFTGKPIIINARVDKNGFERISDYFPDTDSDESVSTPSPKEPEPVASQGKDDFELNTSKHCSTTTASTSHCSSETEIDSSPVFLPNRFSSSAKKPVFSPTKVSPPAKPVFSPVEQFSSQEKQVKSSERPGAGIPPASVSSPLMLSSPEENMNPGTTRKNITASESNQSAEDEYIAIITHSRKEADTFKEKSTTRKSAKHNKRKTSTREYSENKDDLQTKKIRRGKDTFLTLKKESNSTLP